MEIILFSSDNFDYDYFDKVSWAPQHSYTDKPMLRWLYTRGLKLKLIGGPHSKEKMLRRPQFIGENAYAGFKLIEKL